MQCEWRVTLPVYLPKLVVKTNITDGNNRRQWLHCPHFPRNSMHASRFICPLSLSFRLACWHYVVVTAKLTFSALTSAAWEPATTCRSTFTASMTSRRCCVWWQWRAHPTFVHAPSEDRFMSNAFSPYERSASGANDVMPSPMARISAKICNAVYSLFSNRVRHVTMSHVAPESACNQTRFA